MTIEKELVKADGVLDGRGMEGRTIRDSWPEGSGRKRKMTWGLKKARDKVKEEKTMPRWRKIRNRNRKRQKKKMKKENNKKNKKKKGRRKKKEEEEKKRKIIGRGTRRK